MQQLQALWRRLWRQMWLHALLQASTVPTLRYSKQGVHHITSYAAQTSL